MSLLVAGTSLAFAVIGGSSDTSPRLTALEVSSARDVDTVSDSNVDDGGNSTSDSTGDNTGDGAGANSGNDGDGSSNGNTITVQGEAGSTICVMADDSCVSGVDPETPIKEALQRLARLPGADQDPTGEGPWPFLVLGTNDQGVFYRDGHTVDDHRLPGKPVARDSRPVYADCRVTGAWQADAAAPRTDALTTWLKVRYPEPGDKGDHWVYGGYAFPFGHNGNIPECPAD